MLFGTAKTRMIDATDALPGRDVRPFAVPATHAVLGTPVEGPWPDGLEIAWFGLGCFWGAEEIYWRIPGVYSTAVGYQGGFTKNPTYDEVCSARTGHTEAVQVVFDPAVVSYAELLRVFWEAHDPTQGMRQGNDVGTQYRSTVYTSSPEQQAAAEASRATYQQVLTRAGLDEITTEIAPGGHFWYAEDHHQQYLFKNPNGYRCHSETGVPFPKGE